MRVGAFARAVAVQIAAPDWRGLAILLFIVLAATNAVLALHKPGPGEAPGIVFAITGLVRALGLIWISVAMLRAATGSERGRWMPDAGFWLYFLLSLVAFGASAVAALLAQGLPEIGRVFLMQLIAAVLVSPFAPWTVAAAVERPLALSPRPWFRDIGDWLPPYLLLALVVAVPLAALHAALTMRLLTVVGGASFWPIAIADGLLSTLVALVLLALRLTAYRSVAQG